MRLLDLFCGGGGAAMGYWRSGRFTEIVGVDLLEYTAYPFEYVQADALDFDVTGFDVIHASPPCHAYSAISKARGKQYPMLVEATREKLVAAGVPYIIENVPGAPLKRPLRLCGTMFGLGCDDRELRRHRLFEMNFEVPPLRCKHERRTVGVYGGGPSGEKVKSTGTLRSYQGTVDEKRVAMGIDWLETKFLNEAIPPAYTEYIARFIP